MSILNLLDHIFQNVSLEITNTKRTAGMGTVQERQSK